MPRPTSTLGGVLSLDRSIMDDDLWLAEPFSRGQAWVDLSFLANDGKHTFHNRGVAVSLERGQVGRSLGNLADRWRWSREKVKSFLEYLRDLRKIDFRMTNLTTVITVMDYAVLNPKSRAELIAESLAEPLPEPSAEPLPEPSAEPLPEPSAEPLPDPTPEPTADSTAEPIQKEEGGKEEREKEERGKAPPLKNAVSMKRAIEWLTEQESGYSKEEITGAWCELTAGSIDGNWVTGKPPRPVAHWRSALVSELWKRRELFGKKNDAPSEEKKVEWKLPNDGWDLTLEKMKAQVHGRA